MLFYRSFWRLLKPFQRDFLLFFGLITIYEGFQLADSYFVSFGISRLEQGITLKEILIALGLLLVFDEIYVRLDNFVDFYIISRLIYPIYRYLKTSTLAKFLQMELTWHHHNQSGTLVGKVQNGTQHLNDMVSNISWELAPTILQFVISLAPLIFLLPISIPILILGLGVFIWLGIKKQAQQAPFRKIRHDHYDDEWATMAEGVSYIEAVTTYNQQDPLQNRYQHTLNEIVRLGNLDAQIGIYRYGRWQARIISYAQRIIMLILFYQLMEGTITVASLVFTWTIVVRLVNSFWRFGRLYDRAAESQESIARVQALLAQSPTIADPFNETPIPEGKATIELCEVTYSHNGDNDALRNVSFRIKPGEVVAFVGPSGAGKTTLIRLIMRLIDASFGSVLINGIDVRDCALSKLRALFAYVPQDPPIFNMSLADNIRIGKVDASDAEVVAAAQAAGIHDFIMSSRCPNGYETIVGERGVRLSGGERQRVALARAILAKPRILILDEATSSLDSNTESAIQDALATLLAGGEMTVIIIAHRFATIKHVDQIMVFDQGQLVEQGTHDELMDKNGLYTQLYRNQQSLK